MAASYRFITLDDTQKSKNTTRKTLSDIKLFRQFLVREGLSNIQIEEIQTNQLNDLLTKFILTVQKKDGGDFEPATLRSIFQSIQRYLKEKSCRDISIDPAFEKSRQTLSARQYYLTTRRKGAMPNRSQALSDEDIEELWENKQLGSSHPNSILNTMWLYTSMGFELHDREEHRKMCWGMLS